VEIAQQAIASRKDSRIKTTFLDLVVLKLRPNAIRVCSVEHCLALLQNIFDINSSFNAPLSSVMRKVYRLSAEQSSKNSPGKCNTCFLFPVPTSIHDTRYRVVSGNITIFSSRVNCTPFAKQSSFKMVRISFVATL